MANSHSFSLVPRGHSWSPVCTIRYNRVQHLHEQTAFLTIIFKTLRLIRLTRILSYEPGAKAANSKALPRANCVTIQLTVRAWSHESGWPGLSGWLALPRWLLSRYFMKGPARSHYIYYVEIGHDALEQCVTRCSVSRWVRSPGRPTSVITWKISTRDPGITILGSQLTSQAQLSYNCKVDFCCV